MTSKIPEHESSSLTSVETAVPTAIPAAASDSAPKEPPVQAFKRSVIGLVADIRALSDALPIAMKALSSANESARVELGEFIEKRIKKEDGKDDEFQIKVEDYPDFRDKSERFRHTLTAVLIIPRSVLTALVSQFDAYVGHLLRALFLARPELVNTFESALSLKEIIDLGSIEEAREYMIEREIDKIIRLSHIEQLKWFERTLKIQFTELYDSIPHFVELMERRNLFVHADGVVSRYYLRNCAKYGIDVSKNKQGEKLFVESKYFSMVSRILLEVGVLLGHQVWRRVLKTDISASDDQLGDITFRLIRQGEYETAARMLEFVLTNMPKPVTEKMKLIHTINLSNAYRLMGEKEKSLAVLQREDWSAKSYEYQLGHAVLTQEFGRAADLMIKIGKAGYPAKQDYRDWPLFSEFRESSEFLTAFERVFDEQFAFSQKSVDVSEQEKEVAANLSEAEPAATDTPAS